MHKKILLLILIILLTGCTRIDNTNDYKMIVTNCIEGKKTTNNVALGYKYYVPKGIKKIEDYDYNQVFLVDDTKIYLYVDIISYHYKKELKSEENNRNIYYAEINENNKKGYIEIKEEGNLYFTKIVYNYSKIEMYTSKDNTNKMIALATIILSSVDYNDLVIDKVLEGSFREYSEVTYKIEKPESASNNFSQYLEEYVQKGEKKKLPEE